MSERNFVDKIMLLLSFQGSWKISVFFSKRFHLFQFRAEQLPNVGSAFGWVLIMFSAGVPTMLRFEQLKSRLMFVLIFRCLSQMGVN